jgi:hypothetical protein
MANIKFKTKKHVTLPLLKFQNNDPLYVQFTDAIFTGKVVDDKKEPPKMANVINLETGEEAQIILGAVLVSNLEDTYPNETYVGKQFMIEKSAPEGARKYSLFNITEIEVEKASK